MKLAQPVDLPHPFRRDLFKAIRWFDENAERSLQDWLGPSELGTECTRELAYRLAGTPVANTTADNWFAIIGTAVHDWLACALDMYQVMVLERKGEDRRWLIEQRVEVDNPHYSTSGKTDVFDRDLGEVIDYKLVGATSMKRYRKEGPPQRYRVQAQIYGKGWKQRGYDVRGTTIVFLPRTNFLDSTYVWSAPFDESVADQALARVAAIDQLRLLVPPHQMPAASDDGDHCIWCPFYDERAEHATERGCPGVATAR